MAASRLSKMAVMTASCSCAYLSVEDGSLRVHVGILDLAKQQLHSVQVGALKQVSQLSSRQYKETFVSVVDAM